MQSTKAVGNVGNPGPVTEGYDQHKFKRETIKQHTSETLHYYWMERKLPNVV